MVQWVTCTMTSAGAVIVGLGTLVSSMDLVPVQVAAFILSLGWGLVGCSVDWSCGNIRDLTMRRVFL